ncbi:MAG TPA: DUF4232 domain-containing protein [Streptosporangiaceae bacterium]|jgi:hypothetical protein
MKLALRATRRILGGSALLVTAAVLPGTVLAPTAASAAPAASASKVTSNWNTPRCLIRQTRVSLGRPNGTAGTIFYPLRFTNVSRRTCSMFGWPKTWAESQDGRIIGNASRAVSGPRPFLVLRRGQTVHSTLGIIEAGNICRRPVTAVNLRIRAPRQVLTQLLRFRFQACHGHVTVMTVTPVVAGRG